MIGNKSKLLKKSTIKSLNSISSLKKTKRTKKNSKINQNFLVDILYNTQKPTEIVDKLRDFYKTHIDNEKFLKYEKEFVPFDKSVQGKSGSIVGYLKNKPESVLKVHYLKTNIDKLIYYDGCVELNNKFNEVFMNLLFKNIKYLPNFTSKEVKEVKKHILEIEDFGFGNNSYYILMPLVGLEYIEENNKNKNKKHFITNVRDMINLNHIPFLKKALDENNTEILKLYDEFIAESLYSLFNVFKILQKNLNYINADAKLENIFIKSQKNTKSKFNKLREYGIQIDYVLLLSDLEKSRINIENLKFLTYDNYNFIPNFIVKFIGYQMIRSVRHSCNFKMTKICPKLILNDFDILCLIIDLYTRLIRIDENFLNNTPKITELYKKFLSIKDIDYKKLVKILTENKYNLNTTITRKISKIITQIC
jgi:hypothetical protein